MQPLASLSIHEVARLCVELLVREGDEHLRLGHYVGRGVQEYLPQDHLALGSPTASRACPHDPNRFVTEGRRSVTRAQTPVQSGGQDTGDGVVILWCRYEHGVVGVYLLPQFFYGIGVALVLKVLVEVRYPGEVEALATHPLRRHLVRRSHDAAVDGGPPEAAGEAEYPEIPMVYCLPPVSLLDPDLLSSSAYPPSAPDETSVAEDSTGSWQTSGNYS
jgi:hypothetical protein